MVQIQMSNCCWLFLLFPVGLTLGCTPLTSVRSWATPGGTCQLTTRNHTSKRGGGGSLCRIIDTGTVKLGCDSPIQSKRNYTWQRAVVWYQYSLVMILLSDDLKYWCFQSWTVNTKRTGTCTFRRHSVLW